MPPKQRLHDDYDRRPLLSIGAFWLGWTGQYQPAHERTFDRTRARDGPHRGEHCARPILLYLIDTFRVCSCCAAHDGAFVRRRRGIPALHRTYVQPAPSIPPFNRSSSSASGDKACPGSSGHARSPRFASSSSHSHLVRPRHRGSDATAAACCVASRSLMRFVSKSIR